MRPASYDRTGGAGLGCTLAAARGYGTGVGTADVPDGAQEVRRGWGRYTAGVAGLNDPGQDPEAYPHIHSVLARRIRGGEYPAGARLPTEAELADEFGCGPDAAARALRALQRDGLARKVLRRGYVSSGPDAHPG